MRAGSKEGVFEPVLMTRSYLAHGEEGLRLQWETRYTSLCSLVEGTSSHTETESGYLEVIADSAEQMEYHFHELVAAVGDWSVPRATRPRCSGRSSSGSTPVLQPGAR